MLSKGRAKADDIAWMREISGAWYAAAFGRMKKMPLLADVLRRIARRKGGAQTPEQMLAAAKGIVAALGGKDLRKRKDK